MWGLFGKGLSFGPKSFCSEENMARKHSREMSNFWSMCLEASIKVISKILWFLGLAFSVIERVLIGLKRSKS